MGVEDTACSVYVPLLRSVMSGVLWISGETRCIQYAVIREKPTACMLLMRSRSRVEGRWMELAQDDANWGSFVVSRVEPCVLLTATVIH